MKKIINVRVSNKHENEALKTLDFIVKSNGGLTENQIECIKELIEGGYIQAKNQCELIIHN